MLREEDAKAWSAFRHKGPVRYPSAKVVADIAFRRLKFLLTHDQISRISIARAHAYAGEGRDEFDKVCSEIECENSW